MTCFPWTEERTADLKRLWGEGLSCSQIARKLGGTTRNAIIGKIHRLGMSYRATPANPQYIPRAPRRGPMRPAAAPKPKGHIYINQGRVREGCADQPLPPLREIAPTVEPRHWLTRKFGECAWPVSGQGADIFSCCAPTGGAASYCSAHARICFNPAPKTKPYDPNRPDGRRHNGFNFAARKRAVNE